MINNTTAVSDVSPPSSISSHTYLTTNLFQNSNPGTFRLQNQSATFATGGALQTVIRSDIHVTTEVLTHVSSEQVDAKFGEDGYPADTKAV